MLDVISVLIQFFTLLLIPAFGLLLIIAIGITTFKNISDF